LDVDAFIALVGSSKMELDPEEILVQALSSWDMTDSGYVPEER
jgi:Ca2+-binding EF-hand superfamily protein